MIAGAKGLSPAGTLLIEDQLAKIVFRGAKDIRNEKRRGLVPQGSHCLFGNFPPDYMPTPEGDAGGRALFGAGASAARGMSRTASAPALKRNGSTVGPRTQRGFALKTSSMFVLDEPPRAGATLRREIKGSEFRRFYDRGDLPMQIMHGAVGGKIAWKVDIEKLDYHHYLPILLDGCREKEDPYRFLAVQGTYDMLERGSTKILPVVPQLIIPIKTALNTRDEEIVCTVLKILQALVLSGDMIGEALVPYYRQILPIFNIFKNKNVNLGDAIDYSQRKKNNLGDLITQTLELFEIHGGEDAFINIKYMIPTYESCIMS